MKTRSLLSISMLTIFPMLSRAEEPTELTAITVTATQSSEEQNGYQSRKASIAGYEQSTLDIPRAVQTVTQQVIEDKQAKTLGDVLSSVSGIVESNTLAGIQDSFTRRGFGERNDGSILRDGVRSYLMSNFDATTESVEVLKGPASLLYGIQEPGGVINVISKKPQYVQQGSISAQATSFGGGSSVLDLTGPIGDSGLAYRLIGEYQDTDYWRNFGNTRKNMIAPSLAWEDDKNKLLVSYQYVDFSTPWDRGTIFYNGKPINVSRETRLGDLVDVADGHTQAANAVYTRQLNERWSLKTQLSWNEINYTNYETRTTAYTPSTGYLTRRLDGNVVSNSNLTFSTKLMGDLSLFEQNHQLIIGFDAGQTREERSDTYRGTASTKTRLNIYNPVYGIVSTSDTVLSNTVSDNRTKVDTQSILLMDNWEITKRLSANFGLRYQHYQQEDGVGRPYAVTSRASGYTPLPQAALLYKLTQNFSIYGSYSESFEPNSGSDGRSFDPEQGVSHEVGIKMEFQGFSATTALFNIEKSNVQVTENNVTSTIGKVRSQGMEIDVSGQLTKRLSAIGAWAYTDAVVKEDEAAYIGKQLYNVPKHSSSLFLAYDIGYDSLGNRWRAGSGVRYVGLRQGDRANSFQLPSYYVADLFLSWQTKLGSNKLEIQANVKNIFDKTYYTSTAGTNLTVRVGDPRELLVQAKLSF